MSKIEYIKCDICGDIIDYHQAGMMSVKAKVLKWGIESSFRGSEWLWKDAHICRDCVACVRKMREKGE